MMYKYIFKSILIYLYFLYIIYPPPRLREWLAKGVLFLSVFCVPRITFILFYFPTFLLVYLSTFLFFYFSTFLLCLLSACLLSTCLLSVCVLSVLASFVLQEDPPLLHRSNDVSTFWCHILALIFGCVFGILFSTWEFLGIHFRSNFHHFGITFWSIVFTLVLYRL